MHARIIFFYSLCITLLIIAIICYAIYTGRSIAERHYPLIEAAKEIKLEVTTAHLWLEEIISGDQSISIEDVWTHFDKSQAYAHSMLAGDISEKVLFEPLSDPNLRTHIEVTIAHIQHLRQISQTRWSSISTVDASANFDQPFDVAFLQVLKDIDQVEKALKKAVSNDLSIFKLTQVLLIILMLALGILISRLLVSYTTRQINYINTQKLHEEKILKSQQQLQDIFTGAKLGYWDWNYKTGKHLVNDEWLSMLGLNRQHISHDISDWENRIHPQDKNRINKTIFNHLSAGKHYVVEFRIKHANGNWIWIKGSGTVITYDEVTQEPIRLCGIHQDITERKITELRDKSRTKILELITSNEELTAILKAIIKGVEEENPVMRCSILLLDDNKKHFLSGAAPSLPDFYNDAIHGLAIGIGVGSCGTAAFTNKRVIVEDIKTHPYWTSYQELASKAKLGACWSEPIRSTKGEVLGTFAIYHHNKHQPTADNIVLIEKSANLASIAIEKTQANIALKASDEQMKFVLAGADLGYWDWNIVTGKVDINDRWATMLGYSYEEIQTTKPDWVEFLYPEDKEKAREGIKDVLKGRLRFLNIEYRMLTKDGDIRWFHDQANVIKHDDEGNPLRMSGTHADITHRKIAEEKLKLAASVFTYARESIVITDTQGIIIDVNETFTTITGYSREESIGKTPPSFHSERQSEEFYASMWKTLRNEGYWYGKLWNKSKNGKLYAEMKTISAVKNEQGITTHYVVLGNDITSIIEHQKQLEHIAHYDVLTQLPNRVLLADRLSQAMLQCERQKKSLAVLFIDLDGFKLINDTYGHDIGDALLIEISIRMKKALRKGSSIARIGGDEFVAVLTDLTVVSDCDLILERLLKAASEPIDIDKTVLNISASIGVTYYPQDNVNADQLMRHADQAMYIAKESGKNRYHIFDTAQDVAVKVQWQSIEAIRTALEQHQFMLHYQPKVNMKTGTVTGFEALIRWQHPERGLLNPIDFLPMIENNPMLIELGEWVINTALIQINQWQSMAIDIPLNISVNIAPIQLQQSNFTQRLSALLNAHPEVSPKNLELEVLETSALDDVYHASKMMNDCNALGVKFSLDDFGTGYSSLTHLRRLPAHTIKIDRSFVRDMLQDPDDFAIVEGVIALAKSFKREVIAEGVETNEHCIALLQLGCELAQGYGIAKPMPASDIQKWFSSWHKD